MTPLLRLAPILLAGIAFPAQAQEDAPDQENDQKTIVVTAEKIKGSVDTDVPPTLVLDEADIASVGASNLSDLLGALGPQTRSGGRGSGGGFPIILLNGRRVSSFAEMRDLPPEAIQRVEVFPEEVALKLGYPPNQRVVNFILKPGFAALSGEVEYGVPTQGGRSQTELETGWFKVTKAGRFNLNANYTRATAVSEDERDITQPGLNDAALRTLLPKSDSIQLNSVFNRAWKNGVGITLNLGYDHNASASLLGLVPASGTDPINRADESNILRGGLTMDGALGRWQWTLTGNATRASTQSLTDNFLTPSTQDVARSRSTIFGASYSITGSPLRLPAGPLTLNLRAGFDQTDFTSRTINRSDNRRSSVNRGTGLSRVNIDIPLASRDRNIAQPLGDLSINGNFGYQELSDFGGLTNFGFGLTWSPIKGLTAAASFTAEDAAPSPQQLGGAQIITPNVTVFDFVRGETVPVLLTQGGNPALRADARRDVKLGLSFSPNDRLSFEANYFDVRSNDPISSFPSLSPGVEAAFPGRAGRNASGRLVALDNRPINIASTRSKSIRWGLGFSKPFKQPKGPPGMMGGFRPGGAPPQSPGGQGQPRPPQTAGQPGQAVGPPAPGGRPGSRPGGTPGGGRGSGGPGMMMGPGSGGRLFVSLYHSIKLTDEVEIAPGIPKLDLLDGDTLGFSGGSARHSVDLESGWFYNGLGFRLSGNWRSPTRVNTGIGTELRYSGLATFSLRAFVNFDQRKGLIKKMPFLKGSRLAVRLLNITDAVQKVRDQNGLTPFRFQRGFIDPQGRTFEISFRKLF